MLFYSHNGIEIKQRVIEDIIDWVSSEQRVLNILSLPYDEADVFMPVINYEASSGKRTLYITASESGYMSFIDILKKEGFEGYYIYDGKSRSIPKDLKLVITSFEHAITLDYAFDLIIYDDVTEYSSYSKYEIMDILARYYRYSGRIITRSTEIMLKNAPCIQVLSKGKRVPISEPRFVATRLDLEKEIPYIMYEYIQWINMRQRNLAIFTPSVRKKAMVYQQLAELKEDWSSNIIKADGEYDSKQLNSINKLKKNIVVTSSMKLLQIKNWNMDFIVYDSEDKFFDYKKLVYMCVKACKNSQTGNAEAIFLSRNISEDMDKCKEIIRDYNKKAWEMGLVNI